MTHTSYNQKNFIHLLKYLTYNTNSTRRKVLTIYGLRHLREKLANTAEDFVQNLKKWLSTTYTGNLVVNLLQIFTLKHEIKFHKWHNMNI